MENKNSMIWKSFIIAVLFVFMLSAARCQETLYYDTYGTQTTDEVAKYTDVAPLSIPLHFTFAMYDSFNIKPTAKLECDTLLYGIGPSSLACGGSDSKYVTHNTTRYTYEWEVSFDAIIMAYEKDEPVPMLVGRGLRGSTAISELTDYCKGNNLCYTELIPPENRFPS